MRLEVHVGKYTTRFLALTGKATNHLYVNDCSVALQELLDTRMVRPTAEEYLLEQDKGLKLEFATDGAKSFILNWLIE